MHGDFNTTIDRGILKCAHAANYYAHNYVLLDKDLHVQFLEQKLQELKLPNLTQCASFGAPGTFTFDCS